MKLSKFRSWKARMLALTTVAFAASSIAEAEPCREAKELSRALSWAEKQMDLGAEAGDATCAQAKAYGCASEIEELIAVKFDGETCDGFVHTSRSPVVCCLFRSQTCSQMRTCFGGAR